MAIQSFADTAVEAFFFDEIVPRRAGWANIKEVVRRKLTMVDMAEQLSDLKAPPNNRLEALKGELKGFYSIRVNDQWRVIFRWDDGAAGPTRVDVVDYH